MHRAPLAVALAFALLGCSDAGTGPAPTGATDLSLPLVLGSPATEHVDSAALAAAFARGDSVPGLRSLLVLRNGVLVGERYFAGATGDTLFDIRSVTKSVMALLVGLAIQRGLISGVDEPLDSLIHPPVTVVPGDEKRITLEDLLTMTGGFSWDETIAGYNAWVLAPDQIEYLLERGLADPPGARFNYNSAAVHLVSVAISQAAGESTEAFASQQLFPSLGIVRHAWETDHQGFNNGGSGLSLTARDLAKLGQLVLQYGMSGRAQVVGADWVRAMIMPREHLNSVYGPVSNLSYGYLWWMGDAAGHRLLFAWGHRGQFIVLEPRLGAVIVATASLDEPIAADDEAIAVLNLIVQRVLPSLRPT